MDEPKHKNIFSYLEVLYILRIDFNMELGSAELGVIIGHCAGIGVVRSMAHSPTLTRYLL